MEGRVSFEGWAFEIDVADGQGDHVPATKRAGIGRDDEASSAMERMRSGGAANWVGANGLSFRQALA
jgi:hypothetical protein